VGPTLSFCHPGRRDSAEPGARGCSLIALVMDADPDRRVVPVEILSPSLRNSW
jgi:hypothetical protein